MAGGIRLVTLFDESSDRAGAGGIPADGPRPVSLVRLAALISRAATEIGRIAVEGEVHRPSTGVGRQWFTLKDRAAQVSVSVPAARRARCRVVAGERVSVTGRLEWVPAWGQLQLVAEEVVPVGEGAIAAMIEEARRRLAADGLLTRARRSVPRLPAGIGVICGREAAVRADIESVIAARFPGYPVVFVETTVSGAGAPDNVIAALRDLELRPDVDVVIITRGGGDATQLLPFSDEQLCRALCTMSKPVVVAIGHDGDRPLVDDVADLRCGTASLAAAAVIPDRDALRSEIDRWLVQAADAWAGRVALGFAALDRIDLRRAVGLGLDRAGRRVVGAGDQLALMHPARELERARSRLARVDWREPAPLRLAAAMRSLGAARGHVEALSPERVLERGYAVVRRADDGAVVRELSQAPPGAALDVRIAAGRLSATVTGVDAS
ncbi:MAG: exodeoxyribonuclease VII large subunit [Acidimicrobiales bacterium]